jgi:hypothetical protein
MWFLLTCLCMRLAWRHSHTKSCTTSCALQCHRQPPADGKPEVVHPVHCIHYHRGYGTFATGGGDGVVNIWDGDNKKRLFQISK